MQAGTVLSSLALIVLTACSMGQRPVTSSVQIGATHFGPSPAGHFVLGPTSQPVVKLRINSNGTYFAEQTPPIEFWPMIEGNKVYPQRIKPSAEKGNWTWDRKTGTLTLTPEAEPSFRWPIDRLRFDPARPNCLAAGGGVILERVEQ